MLSASRRLRLTRDFERVFADRRALAGRFFRVKVVPNNQRHNRFAVVVSSKVHKRAVVRNRVRRRAWSVISPLAPAMPDGIDVVLVALPQSAKADFDELKSDILYILKKHSRS